MDSCNNKAGTKTYPPYSVLMSLYIKEKPEYLKTSIESMVHQTLPPDEIVIVRDGPLTDALEAVLSDFEARYPGLFHIVGYEENRGLGYALTYGIWRCRNELVARMDTDDISKPDRCQKEVEAFLEDPELDIVGSAIDEFAGSTDQVVSRRVVPTEMKDIYNRAKRSSAFNHPTVMYKRGKVLEAGGYADQRRGQDMELFGRMLYGGCKARNFEESLLYFRTGDDLNKRRKSFEHTKCCIRTTKKFQEMGYASSWDVMLVAAAHIGMYLIPGRLQAWIYKKFLRKAV